VAESGEEGHEVKEGVVVQGLSGGAGLAHHLPRVSVELAYGLTADTSRLGQHDADVPGGELLAEYLLWRKAGDQPRTERVRKRSAHASLRARDGHRS
jgi:hypothetical protein